MNARRLSLLACSISWLAAAQMGCAPIGPDSDAQLEENRRIARELFDALSRGDIATVDRLYADDFEIWTAGSMPFSGRHDKAYALGATDMILGAFPQGIAFTIDAMTTEGERIAIEAHSDGAHVSGTHYHNEYHFLLRIRDGQVVEFKEYMDTALATEVLVGGQ